VRETRPASPASQSAGWGAATALPPSSGTTGRKVEEVDQEADIGERLEEA
jgi:hypothetical protein